MAGLFGVGMDRVAAALRAAGGNRMLADELLRREQAAEPAQPSPPPPEPAPAPRVYGRATEGDPSVLPPNPYPASGRGNNYSADAIQRARSYIDRQRAAEQQAVTQPAPISVDPAQLERAQQRVAGVNPNQSIRGLQRGMVDDANQRIGLGQDIGENAAQLGEQRAVLSTATADEQHRERLTNADRNAAALGRTDEVRADQHETIKKLQELVANKPGEDSPRLRKAADIMSMIPGAHLFARPMARVADERDERKRQDWADRQAAARNLIETESGLISNENASTESEGRSAHTRAVLANVENLNRLEAVAQSAESKEQRLAASIKALQEREKLSATLIGQRQGEAAQAVSRTRSAAENDLWNMGMDELARGISGGAFGRMGLAKQANDVYKQRAKNSQDVRKGEIDIESSQAEGALNSESKRAEIEYRLSQAEKNRREAGGTAPGAEVAGGYRVKNPQIWGSLPAGVVAKFSEAQSRLPGLISEMTELKSLVDKHGTETLPGETKSRMEELQASITSGIKEVDQLGALDKGVSELVTKRIGDSTAWNMGLGNVIENADTKLGQAIKDLQSGARSRAASLGLESALKGGGGGAPAGGGSVEMVNTQTGEKRLVAPAFVDAYAEQGFVPSNVPDEKRQANAQQRWPGGG
jgi:hypothetical protein